MQRWRAGAWRADAYKRDDRQNECWPMGFLDTLWAAKPQITSQNSTPRAPS